MKRFLVVLLLALPMLGASAQNVKQEKSDSFLVVMPQSFFERLSASYNFSLGLQNKNTTPLMMGVDFGYEVLPRLRVTFKMDYAMALRSVKGVRTYDDALLLGGGLSYRLFGGKGYTQPAQAKDALELQFTAGGSVERWIGNRITTTSDCYIPPGIGFPSVRLSWGWGTDMSTRMLQV